MFLRAAYGIFFVVIIFFLHMFDYIFKQCNAGSLLDQMNSFWWLCCCKMNLTPLPPGIPALCHRMHAGWPRPCHQATRSGCELLVVWVAAWGVDRNRYHTDPYVFIVVCVCVLIWVHHPQARFAECFGAFRSRLYNFLKKPSFCWWVVQPNKKGGAWVLKPECLMLSYAKQPRWKKAAPWQDVAVWEAQTWLSINVKFSMVTWYLHVFTYVYTVYI